MPRGSDGTAVDVLQMHDIRLCAFAADLLCKLEKRIIALAGKVVGGAGGRRHEADACLLVNFLKPVIYPGARPGLGLKGVAYAGHQLELLRIWHNPPAIDHC